MQAENGVFHLMREDTVIPGELRRFRNASVQLRRFKHVEELSDFPNIAHLEVFHWPLETFDALAPLTGLRTLHVNHSPKLRSLNALRALAELRDLELTTLASWYGKKQTVDSLRPLSSLGKLRSLRLEGVHAKDNDLAPLGKLRTLRKLFVSNIYPQEQLARLAGRLRRVDREWFLLPFVSMENLACRKCGTSKVMLSGSDIRPRAICPQCQGKKLESCVRQFENWVRESRRSGK